MSKLKQAIYSRISRCVEGRCGAEYGDESRLAAIGIESLQFILVILELEEEFGVSVFDQNNIAEIATIGDMITLFEKAMPEGIAYS